MKILKFVLVMVAATLLLSGCAATGSYYKPVESIPAGKGIIIFYRPQNLVGAGAKPKLIDNGKEIGRIQNGQFIQYLTEPGWHEFNTKTLLTDKAVEFEVEEGKIYYVHIYMGVGTWTKFWRLTRIDEDVALYNLKYCCKSDE